MIKREKLAEALRTLAEFVESCSGEELLALEAIGMSSLMDDTNAKPTERKSKRARPARDESIEIAEALDSLRYVTTRDSGFSYLQRKGLSRRALEAVARRLDLPVLREDTVQRIIERIVESSIGSRLNSEAIRGESSDA